MLERDFNCARVMVRKLPVLQSQDSDDALAANRPRWHWVLIGAGFVLTLFLPLAELGLWLGHRVSEAASFHGGLRVGLGALPVAFSFLLACALAGALVGRFGGRAKAREAALSGALGAFGGWLLAALGGALSPWLVALVSLLILLVLGTCAAFVGARFGLSRRV